MFGGAPQMPGGPMLQWRVGKATLEGTTVTAEPKKGLLVLQKSDDQLMHLIWKDRETNTVVEDLIVFEGDATIKHLDGCKDGFAVLLEFTQTARKIFFWSQEPRKKGGDFSDVSKEKELLEKANAILSGGSASAPAGAGIAGAVGALGMTHTELMAMLGGAMPAGAAATPTGGAAAAAAPAASTPGAAPAAVISADALSNILGAIPPADGDAAAAATPAPFSADAISNILGAIPPADGAAAPAPATDGDEAKDEADKPAEPMDES